ncbi:hypothetical protein NL676_009874 [Syzygium grande]|nr:hypothetical protein NL676_009874 [Syzygium grande]
MTLPNGSCTKSCAGPQVGHVPHLDHPIRPNANGGHVLVHGPTDGPSRKAKPCAMNRPCAKSQTNHAPRSASPVMLQRTRPYAHPG